MSAKKQPKEIAHRKETNWFRYYLQSLRLMWLNKLEITVVGEWEEKWSLAKEKNAYLNL